MPCPNVPKKLKCCQRAAPDVQIAMHRSRNGKVMTTSVSHSTSAPAPGHEARDQAEHGADGDAEEGRHEGDLERRLAAVEDAQEHVAPGLPIAAQDVERAVRHVGRV